ncbi:hypothetical protein AYR56_12470 (plasmid) [Loigolactobacillus backii]|uniref:Helix-turn-helix type 11 domain-containing protein n=3 Tax=Lactobacillales TaxID=186826 RepID=A0A192H4A0_9LACO|nr:MULTISPECIES: hypothetical protein [Lactobacillales]ANK63644.1 hypothetical protein AYR53_12525 [Loigolactobacillus backii]ANK71012.1 hypothetical protein AYR56_12470 [Loigolactobacillus backii]TRW58601.1 hypothetical protein FNJ56_12670 [Lactococcus lactis]TRW66074.1 hypothetical protein FNJ57_12640 [Lactococcus lactis]
MSENLKTIKELADELGVSKSYIDKIIRILELHTKLDKVGNKYVISKKQEKSIKDRLRSSESTTKSHTKSTTKTHTEVDFEVDFLKEEILYLRKSHDKQLTNKDKQIETLSNLLDQQQRLALQDKKLLEEYKAENDRLKVLKMPSQETEFKHLDNQYKDEVNALKEKLENLQEQIKDQKRIEEQEKPRKWWGLWRK